MAQDTRSPETSYGSRTNIIIPKTDPRTAASIRNTAAALEADDDPTPITVTAATNVLTKTHVSQTKEV